jgi:hypothetical protein
VRRKWLFIHYSSIVHQRTMNLDTAFNQGPEGPRPSVRYFVTYSRAKAAYDSHRIKVTEWNAVVPELNNKNTLLVPHCLNGDCADAIKQETAEISKTAAEVDPRAPSMGAKSLCSF